MEPSPRPDHVLACLCPPPSLPCQAYAMTEASHQMTSNPLPKHGEHRPGTVGKAQGSVQVWLRRGLAGAGVVFDQALGRSSTPCAAQAVWAPAPPSLQPSAHGAPAAAMRRRAQAARGGHRVCNRGASELMPVLCQCLFDRQLPLLGMRNQVAILDDKCNVLPPGQVGCCALGGKARCAAAADPVPAACLVQVLHAWRSRAFGSRGCLGAATTA